jgi:uncharacterized protein with HEPN domain
MSRDKEFWILLRLSRYILVMGEATKQLSSEFRQRCLKISWENIAGILDIIENDYNRIGTENF